MAFLQTKNLTIGYPPKVIQENLSLSLERGKLVCLLGTNGCGKSTLLRTLAHLQKPISGEIFFEGEPLSGMKNEARSTLFSLVLTDSVEVENMTVFDLVMLGRFPYTSWSGRLRREDRLIVEKVISQVNLVNKKYRFISELSDGEKQRAVIAKALAQETPLVILDEPTAHLDLPNRIEVMMLLRKLAHEMGKCFILSSHELDLSMQLADVIWLMEKGVHIGIPEDLMLNGLFTRVFGSKSYGFDPRDGHFSVYYKRGEKRVSVFGDELQSAWLIRALRRNSIDVVESAFITIEAKGGKFILQKEYECSSISEVIEKLYLIGNE
ncbi:MAG: ABC transporter ATP-binding protein [Paludibacteraceae bacterium]|nr:ABC transporter ATP-binding protein [Paludibacteraceae bacterium]